MPAEDPNPRTPDDDSLIKGNNWLSGKIVNFLGSVTPLCSEMTHLISEEMDHSLPWPTRIKMRLHFLFCCYCERYKKNLHYLRKLMRAIPWLPNEASVEMLPPEARERLKQVLRDQASSS